MLWTEEEVRVWVGMFCYTFFFLFHWSEIAVKGPGLAGSHDNCDNSHGSFST